MSSPSRLLVLAGFVWAQAVTPPTRAADPPPGPPKIPALFPASGATDVCPDTPLRLTFDAPPTLGPAGKIQIFDAATHAVVDTIDVSSPTATKTIGGMAGFNYYPVIITGNTAAVFPQPGVLAYGKSYEVTADASVFSGVTGLDQPGVWRFTTKPAAPATGATRLIVAADGTGDFCTVQGALDAVPAGNTAPVTIFIRRGTYPEIVAFSAKHAVTLRGEDRAQTIITYANNANFNGLGSPYRRGLFLAFHTHDLTITNLTLRNTTRLGGSQAESIILDGTTSAHAILRDVDLFSRQDTLQINGQAYVSGCHIEGDVDFMWGTGPCFFVNCTAQALRSNAYYTQIRNPATNHGYVYVDCTFGGAAGVAGNFLSRIEPGRFPASEVVLLDCVLGPAVGAVAWRFDAAAPAGAGGRGGAAAGAPNPPLTPPNPSGIHFWEFNSHTADGQPVDVSQRLAASRQLKPPDDAALIANYRDPSWVLGGDWKPLAAPIFAEAELVSDGALGSQPSREASTVAEAMADRTAGTASRPTLGQPAITVQPVGQVALAGTSPELVVAAAGAGPLIYQWSRNGTPIPGANSPGLRLTGLTAGETATYVVVVADAAGTVTSEPARVTVAAPMAAPAPQLPVIPSREFDVTARGAVADGATDNTAVIQQTIDAAVAAGGGNVVFPAAAMPYLSGPIRLGNQINLQVNAGATLRALPYSATPRAGAYPLTGAAYAHFITASNAHDVALTGGGTIDGDGAAWWAAFTANKAMPHRPYLIRLGNCERVLVAGLTLVNSPMFHAALGANHLTVFGVTINSPDAPNTDGLDPSGSHQLIQGCAISCGDDNIALKPGGTFCADVTVADCKFGRGHGVSIGGQTNRGLDGLTVKNCTFEGTTSGLRLKADATEGGPVQNVTCTDLVMTNVPYPLVFYSYYNQVGNPGTVSGSLQTTPTKVKAWNAAPPNPLPGRALPTWKNITISHLTATGTRGHSIIWGLPLPVGLFDQVRLDDVHITGGPGLEIYNATNVRFTGGTEVGPLITCNALVLIRQPADQAVVAGTDAIFTVGVAGTSGVTDTAPAFQWSCDGRPLTDGPRPDGAVVAGATTATLSVAHVQPGEAGRYAVTVTNHLDVFDVAANALRPGGAEVAATSETARLSVR